LKHCITTDEVATDRQGALAADKTQLAAARLATVAGPKNQLEKGCQDSKQQ
jgi:hypothetical protein